MSDATNTMITTIGATIAKNALMGLGAALVTHGVIASSNTEMFVSVGMMAVGGIWSFWTSYGRAIVLSKLEVLKAKSLAQAAALEKHDIPPPTVVEIAEHSPTLTATDVAKVVAKIALALTFISFAIPAFAQTPRPRVQLPFDPLNLNDKIAAGKLTGSPLNDLLGALDAKLLPDLQYALKLAEASGSKVTAPCYTAWIDIINTRQKANLDDQGQPIVLPEPHIITDFEKMVELRNSLQPDSPFMIACSPVASMVKKDIAGFIGIVLSGGAGLATLVPGL